MTPNSGREQFAAIPIRAMGDTRLSAADFRVLAAIAYHDRFRRNGSGCYVDFRKLSERAGVRPEHWSRHTGRLFEFGYITIELSATDRRRRVYSLIYDDAEAGAATDTASTSAPADTEKVAKDGVIHKELVTNADLQPVDPQGNPDDLRYPVKQIEDIPRSGRASVRKASGRLRRNQQPTVARQWGPGAGSEHRQLGLRVFADVTGKYRRQRWEQVERRFDQAIEPNLEWYQETLRQGFEDVRKRAIAIEAKRPAAGLHYIRCCVNRAERAG